RGLRERSIDSKLPSRIWQTVQGSAIQKRNFRQSSRTAQRQAQSYQRASGNAERKRRDRRKGREADGNQPGSRNKTPGRERNRWKYARLPRSVGAYAGSRECGTARNSRGSSRARPQSPRRPDAADEERAGWEKHPHPKSMKPQRARRNTKAGKD